MASNDEDAFASENDSVPEFSASEDEWDPTKENAKSGSKPGR